MTREDIEKQVKEGGIPKSEYREYWEKSKARHLEEVAVLLDSNDWPDLKAWIKTWGHKGGSWYLGGQRGYAVRCGGANQHTDPLNVFFLSD